MLSSSTFKTEIIPLSHEKTDKKAGLTPVLLERFEKCPAHNEDAVAEVCWRHVFTLRAGVAICAVFTLLGKEPLDAFTIVALLPLVQNGRGDKNLCNGISILSLLTHLKQCGENAPREFHLLIAEDAYRPATKVTGRCDLVIEGIGTPHRRFESVNT
jgi:hypothetical protein